MARQRDSAEATINALDMNKVRDHYLNRKRTQEELRGPFGAEEVQAFARLGLGISNAAGNYSAAEHCLGSRILSENSEQDIFDLATAIEDCPNIQHLPKLIYD